MNENSQSDNQHNNCILCGSNNPYSLNLEFEFKDDKSVEAEFTGNEYLQGYDNILHGGVISSILDSSMTHCLFHNNVKAVTGELKVRYVEQIPCNSTITIKASIVFDCNPLYKMKSELIVNNKIMAKAEAKFVRIKRSDESI